MACGGGSWHPIPQRPRPSFRRGSVVCWDRAPHTAWGGRWQWVVRALVTVEACQPHAAETNWVRQVLNLDGNAYSAADAPPQWKAFHTSGVPHAPHTAAGDVATGAYRGGAAAHTGSLLTE